MAKYATKEHNVKCDKCLITFALFREGIPLKARCQDYSYNEYYCPNCHERYWSPYWSPIFSPIDASEYTQKGAGSVATMSIRNRG